MSKRYVTLDLRSIRSDLGDHYDATRRDEYCGICEVCEEEIPQDVNECPVCGTPVVWYGSRLWKALFGSPDAAVRLLNIIEPEDTMKIHPADAEELGIADGEMVKVTSRRGDKVTRAKVTDIVPPKVVYMDFHFGESPTNILTNCAVDPICKVPEYKACGVRIEKVTA